MPYPAIIEHKRRITWQATEMFNLKLPSKRARVQSDSNCRVSRIIKLFNAAKWLPHNEQYFLWAIAMLLKIQRMSFDRGLVSKLGHRTESFRNKGSWVKECLIRWVQYLWKAS